MSLPRMLVPGGTYLITRGTSDRRFLLSPDQEGTVADIMRYCLAYAAQKHGVALHAVCVMSSHLHIVVTDHRAELSDFMAWIDRHLALCLLNVYRRRFPERTLQAIWSKTSFNSTLLVTNESIQDSIVYCLSNPVKDNLVVDYRKWPGLCSRPRDWRLEPEPVPRPLPYFGARSSLPKHAPYQLTIPTQFIERRPEEFIEHTEQLLRDTMAQHRAERKGPVLGVAAVLRTDPFDQPGSPWASGTRTPTVKASGNRVAYTTAIRAVRAFRKAYADAWAAFRAGLERAFPEGTLLMVRRFGLPCEPADFSWCSRAPATG